MSRKRPDEPLLNGWVQIPRRRLRICARSRWHPIQCTPRGQRPRASPSGP